MKSLFFIFLLLGVTFQIWALSTPLWQLESKVDYLKYHSNDRTPIAEGSDLHKGSNGEQRYNQFNLSVARLGAQGDFNTYFSYFFKWNMAKSFSSEREQLDTVDELSIIYRPNDIWGLQMGKFFTGVGGVEGSYYYDQLHHQYFFSPTHLQYGELTHKVGFSAHFNWKNQTIQGMVFSGRDKSLASADDGKSIKNNQKPGIGVVWHGRFMEDQLHTIASYHFLPLPEQKDSPSGVTNSSRRSDRYMALGVRRYFWDKQYALEFDSLWNHSREYPAGADMTSHSLVLNNKVTIGSWGGVIKGAYTQQKRDKKIFLRQWDVGLGGEYYPQKETDFRLHLFYHHQFDKYLKSYQTHHVGQRISTNMWQAGMALGF